MWTGDKYGLKNLEIGQTIVVADNNFECSSRKGYQRMYVRLRNLAAQKGIKVSIKLNKLGDMNVTRIK